MNPTEKDIDLYNRDGVVCLRNVINSDWLAFLATGVSDLAKEPGAMSQTITSAGSSLVYSTDLELAQHISKFDHFARCSPCAGIAGGVLQSEEINFLYDQYFCQQYRPDQNSSKPNNGTATTTTGQSSTAGIATTNTAPPSTPWHQDQPYWSVEGKQVVSLWIPLDATPPGFEVQFIQGSHQWQEHCPIKFASNTEYKNTGQPSLPNIDTGIAEGTYKVLSFPDCLPGDVIVFSANTVHGQNMKRSEGDCCARSVSDADSWWSKHLQFRRLATRYTGDDARYKIRQGEAGVIPSQLYPALGLKEGGRLTCARLPLVWTRREGLVATSSNSNKNELSQRTTTETTTRATTTTTTTGGVARSPAFFAGETKTTNSSSV